ncbi:MAG: ribbon-helix-helix protein, CopG family [Verrucomicrobiales bacterium]|nr:ribbon-helix-helix protein, CopG family [Verrucomicrobiales bacterium]
MSRMAVRVGAWRGSDSSVTKNFSIRLPNSDRDRLQELSRSTGLTESVLIRQCVRQYLPVLTEVLAGLRKDGEALPTEGSAE